MHVCVCARAYVCVCVRARARACLQRDKPACFATDGPERAATQYHGELSLHSCVTRVCHLCAFSAFQPFKETCRDIVGRQGLEDGQGTKMNDDWMIGYGKKQNSQSFSNWFKLAFLFFICFVFFVFLIQWINRHNVSKIKLWVSKMCRSKCRWFILANRRCWAAQPVTTVLHNTPVTRATNPTTGI